MGEDKRTGDPKEVLLEFQRIGNAVKVTAVDPETLIEVSIVGDAGAGQEMLKRLAIRKLRYVRERRSTPDSPTIKPGQLV